MRKLLVSVAQRTKSYLDFENFLINFKISFFFLSGDVVGKDKK